MALATGWQGCLNEPVDVLSLASAAGYRCFTTTDAFRSYVKSESARSGCGSRGIRRMMPPCTRHELDGLVGLAVALVLLLWS